MAKKPSKEFLKMVDKYISGKPNAPSLFKKREEMGPIEWAEFAIEQLTPEQKAQVKLRMPGGWEHSEKDWSWEDLTPAQKAELAKKKKGGYEEKGAGERKATSKDRLRVLLKKEKEAKQSPAYKTGLRLGWGTDRLKQLQKDILKRGLTWNPPKEYFRPGRAEAVEKAKVASDVKPKGKKLSAYEEGERQRRLARGEPDKRMPSKTDDDRGIFESISDFLYTGSTSKNRAEAQRKRKEYDEQLKASKARLSGGKVKPKEAPYPTGKVAPIYAKDAPYDWDKQVKRIAGEKKLPPVKQPAKKLDRIGQIRQRLKSLIKPDRKYSRAQGLEKAKLYKEMASLGKPSKFGDYWIKTYLGKKPKAVEKTPAPVSVVKKDPDKMPSLDVKKIIEGKKWKDEPKKDMRMVSQPREGEKKEPKVVKGVHAGKMGEKLRELKSKREEKRKPQALELMRESHRGKPKQEPIKPKKESFMERMNRKYGKSKFAGGGDVKKYQGELKEEVGGMSSKGKDFLRKMLKKARGGEVEKYKSDLHKEVAGMGPEGKSYLRDKLHGREYEGKLKGKYKEDLDKELRGMSEPGKISLKKMVEPKDAWKDVKKELEPREGEVGMRGAPRGSIAREGELRNPKARKAGRHAGGLSLGQEIEGSRAEKARLREREGVKKSDIQFARGGEALGREIEGSPAEKARLREGQGYAKGDINYAKGGESKNWIQGAVKKPGALRAVAAKEGLIKGDQKLSSSDLGKLAGQAKKKGNKLLAKRVALAKTFAKMRR